jgi:hypothetical protein
MNALIRKTNLPIILTVITLVAILLIYNLALAGGAAGDPRTIERDIHVLLQDSLSDEGYFPRERIGFGRRPDPIQNKKFQQSTSAYLWDNRDKLKTVDIPPNRNFDLLICLMINKGQNHFREYIEDSFMEWCGKITK